MTTNNHSYIRYILIVCFFFSLAILTACKPKPSASQPFPDLKEWDLLIISNSTNWGVGQFYAKLIEADMKVKVNLHDCWHDALSIGETLKTLQNGGYLSSHVGDLSCLQPWSELVKEAEVMVLTGNHLDSYPSDGSWNIPNSFNQCYYGGYEGKNLQPGFEAYKDTMLNTCAPETFYTYKAQWEAVLDEIDKIREGRPLILRMTTEYIPIHSDWLKYGVDAVCTICFGYSPEIIRQVAEAHGVPLADTMLALSGKYKLSDPPAEYIGPDGIHPSDAGAQFIASLLQQTGYEYAGK